MLTISSIDATFVSQTGRITNGLILSLFFLKKKGCQFDYQMQRIGISLIDLEGSDSILFVPSRYSDLIRFTTKEGEAHVYNISGERTITMASSVYE